MVNDFLRPYLPVAQPDLRRIPVAWRWSGAISQGLRPFWLRRSGPMVRRSLARVRHIIANSHYTESVLLETNPRVPRGGPSVRLRRGRARHFFDVARQPAGDGIPRLLTVCRLSEPRKETWTGYFVPCRYSRTTMSFGTPSWVMGMTAADSKRLASDLRLSERARFTGYVSRDELLDIYAHSDLMVLASDPVTRDSHEGFGIVYLEAAASAVAFACCPVGWRGGSKSMRENPACTWREATIEALTEGPGKVPWWAGSIRPEGLPRLRPSIHLGKGRGSLFASTTHHCPEHLLLQPQARPKYLWKRPL